MFYFVEYRVDFIKLNQINKILFENFFISNIFENGMLYV